VDQLAADASFRALLMGRMRLGSFGHLNQLLIAHQRPSATWVQGARQWERFGRSVRPKAKAIEILAPSRAHQPWPFQVVRVFDVAETDGPDLPAPILKIEGDANCLPAVEAAAPLLGLRVETVPDPGVDHGAIVLGRATGGVVQVRADLEEVHRCRVLVHGYAHELLHLDERQRDDTGGLMGTEVVREAEADATAFLVLGMLGVRADCPSYIAWRGGTGEAILRSLRRILAAARTVRRAIEGRRSGGSIPRMSRNPKRGGAR